MVLVFRVGSMCLSVPNDTNSFHGDVDNDVNDYDNNNNNNNNNNNAMKLSRADSRVRM